MSATAPPVSVSQGRYSPSSPAAASPSSPASRSSSSSSSFEEIDGPAPGPTSLSAQPEPSDGSASGNAGASDRQGTSPSDPAAAQLQLSQPGSARAATDAHSVSSPVELTSILRRRHTNQTPSSPQRQDQADGRADAPPTLASKAWSFFLQKVDPISGFLGLVLAFVFGIGAWVGMNYANTYSKQQYNIALFSACHDYEDIRNTALCEKVINAGIAPSGLVKRQELISTDDPVYASQFIYSPLTATQLLLRALWEIGSYTLAATARHASNAYFMLWTFPMSIQDGGDFYPDSHGLTNILLQAWRITLFIIWQAIMFGGSRFCSLVCMLSVSELLPESAPKGAVLDGFAWALLSFDAVYVMITQGWAHWVPALVLLLVISFVVAVSWAENPKMAENMLAPLLTFAGTISLLIVFPPCELMHAVRIGVLCICSMSFFAPWEETGAATLTMTALGMLGTFLDLLHPNMVTALFTGARCG
ncbi:hypothetical protein BJY00DRAFT_279336 [Aspergillus carlsbadensis]|nr:hypothetical protein BJY00DRAFT_279336 [Aspergillus carlsbadensis]